MGRVPAVAPRRHIRNCEHFSVFFGSRRISRFPLTGETAAMLFSLRKHMVRCTSKHLGHPTKTAAMKQTCIAVSNRSKEEEWQGLSRHLI